MFQSWNTLYRPWREPELAPRRHYVLQCQQFRPQLQTLSSHAVFAKVWCSCGGSCSSGGAFEMISQRIQWQSRSANVRACNCRSRHQTHWCSWPFPLGCIRSLNYGNDSRRLDVTKQFVPLWDGEARPSRRLYHKKICLRLTRRYYLTAPNRLVFAEVYECWYLGLQEKSQVRTWESLLPMLAGHQSNEIR